MDTPILKAIPFIATFFNKGYYGFINMKTYSIFVAYKRSFIFIAEIVDGAKEVIDKLFMKKNIEYVDDLSKICDISEICRIDEKWAQL